MIEPWYAQHNIAEPDPSWPWCMQPNQFMLTHVGGGMVTDRFIHIGMPHTGGSAIHQWLPQLKGLRVINVEGHKPYSYSVDRCKEVGMAVPPAFTLVRNPWEWNVAIWCWIRRINRKWFCGSFDDLLELQRYTRHWSLPDINVAGETAAWEYLECDRAAHICKLENYENDLVEALEKLGVIPALIGEAGARNKIRTIGWTNYSAPPDGIKVKPYQEFYTPAQRTMVEKFEAGIIKRFGYSFNDPGRNYK